MTKQELKDRELMINSWINIVSSMARDHVKSRPDLVEKLTPFEFMEHINILNKKIMESSIEDLIKEVRASNETLPND